MAKPQLEREVRKRVLEVKRRRIVGRIVELMDHFGALQRAPVGFLQKQKGLLKLSVKGAETAYSVESFGALHNSYKVVVAYGDYDMLELSVGLRDIGDTYDRRRMVNDESSPLGPYTVVHCYKRGVWQEPLDLKRLIREQEREKRRRAAIAEKVAAEAVPRYEPRDTDRELAKSLGLEDFHSGRER